MILIKILRRLYGTWTNWYNEGFGQQRQNNHLHYSSAVNSNIWTIRHVDILDNLLNYWLDLILLKFSIRNRLCLLSEGRVAYFGPTSGALQHFSRYWIFLFKFQINDKFIKLIWLNQVLDTCVQQLIIHLIFIFRHWPFCLIIVKKLFNDPGIYAMPMIKVNLVTVYHSKSRKQRIHLFMKLRKRHAIGNWL